MHRNSIHLNNLGNRTPSHGRNPRLEQLLQELGGLLGPLDERVTRQFKEPKWPPLFLIGSPRSGTTFAMQLLGATGQFAIPTNLLSRFYYAPFLGAKIQQLLTDEAYDYNKELSDLGAAQDFHSDLGKTRGVLAPNEFTYFWRRFIPNYDPEYLSPAQEELIDRAGLASGLAAIESVFQKPLALKAFIIQYNLPKLYDMFRNAVFVRVRRDVVYIMQSLYEARMAFYNRLDLWWSVKPKEYSELQAMDPYRQIAGQVFFTETALAQGLAGIPRENQLSIEYEDVCSEPSDLYAQVRRIYQRAGLKLPETKALPKAFSPSNKMRIPPGEIDRLTNAYATLAAAAASTSGLDA